MATDARQKQAKILDNLRAAGFADEADDIECVCAEAKDDWGESLIRPDSIRQAARFIKTMPLMYVPRADISHNAEQEWHTPTRIEMKWHTKYNIRRDSQADFRLEFFGKDGVKWYGHIRGSDRWNGDGGTVKTVKDAVAVAREFFSCWPETPRVNVTVEPGTPLASVLEECRAVITDYESLEQAVSDAYHAANMMSERRASITVSKTGVPIIDECGARLEAEYKRTVEKHAEPYRRAVLADLFPLVRLLLTMRGREWGIPTVMPHGIFQECAKAANVDACWRCGSLGDTVTVKQTDHGMMCAACMAA